MNKGLTTEDTIAAIASAAGGGLRGIIRISGPRCVECIEQCFDRARLDDVKLPRVIPGQVYLKELDVSLPVDLYLWPGSRSYTRQPSAEVHTVGSPPLLEALLAELCRHGARVARPGEFTLRAFLAGRLDLTQAEAVLGVIDARSEQQLRSALSQLAGGMAEPLRSVRNRLLDLLSHLEAGLDFVDEDISFISRDNLLAELGQAAQQIEFLSSQMHSRSESESLPRVVLCGLPNAGKSSLLNALAGEEAALVSGQAGTTRDVVSRRIHMEGLALELVDTAGMETAAEMDIAGQAQNMSREQAENCQLQVLCVDATSGLPARGADQLFDASNRVSVSVPQIVALTKCDLVDLEEPPSTSALRTSSRTGEGIGALRSRIARELASQPSDAVVSAAARCKESLTLAAETLRRALAAAEEGVGEEYVAAEVRGALDDLGRVVGAVYTEDILDRIFSRFCIGK